MGDPKFFDCAAHPDGQEGLKAFSEERKPRFNIK